MRRLHSAALVSLVLGAGCNQVLGLGDFFNECGGPLDAPNVCLEGAAGGESSTTTTPTTSTAGTGGAASTATSSTGGSASSGATGGGGAGAGGSGGAPDHCGDGRTDGDETDGDCGGSCSPCALGAACEVAADCVTSNCTGEVCSAPTCTDSAQNGDETDVDCGGSCDPCAEGLHCVVDGDCVGTSAGRCNGGVCTGTCTDGQQNGAETDTDCGGPMCLPCDYGLACSVGSDCITGLCEASTCAHVTAVSVSPTFACALTEGGGVRCWGANDFGQIGDGTASQRLRPTQVSGLTSGVAQVATGDRVACARMTGGEVRCWGTNDKGQVGVNATTTSLFATPQTLTGLTATSIAVAMGGCAISAGGVQCWGDNSRGQVGDGTTTTRYAPVASNVTTGVSAISSQAKTACELGGNRVVECWGDNSSRQLGDGNSNTYETAAVRVLPTAFLSQGPLAVGGDFACAQGYPSFSVACWGSNDHGQMGTGTIGGQNTQATGVSVGASGGLATGTATVCAINSTGGSVACWGKNTSGELGDGTTTDRASPVDITAKLPGIPTSMSIGDASTCAVIGGSLYCWGDNSGGQLGNGSMTNHLAPQKVVF